MRKFNFPLTALILSTSLVACGGGGGTTEDSSSTADTTTDTPSTTDVPTTGAGSCGDGVLDDGENCDGDALDDKTCADLDASFSGGALGCTADCKFDTSACETDPDAGQIALNEVSSKGASDGPYADLGDAIELINTGKEAVDLTGWRMSDDLAFPIDKTYVFPPGSNLAPGAFLVLTELDPNTSVGDFPFGLSTSKEETITLTNAGNLQIDQLIVQGADATVSYCRLPDGTGAWQGCDLTLGGANVVASMTCGDAKLDGAEACDGAELDAQTCTTLGFTAGALACTAICTLDASACESAADVTLNEVEATDDRVELFNSGADAVDISGWILTDDPISADYDAAADPEKLVFGPGTTLEPGAFLVVPKGDLAGRHPFGLSDTGDSVTLLDADQKPVSTVAFGPAQAALSYCRLPDGPDGTWTADCVPTFGAANEAP
jgi:hypothetical protein